MNFEFSAEFSRDLKRLKKKWRSLPSDVEYVKPRIESLYTERDDMNLAQYRTDFFAGKTAAIIKSIQQDVEIVKMRLDVESPGAKNKARIVFVAVRSAGTITFIELYAKSEKDREDQTRIKPYL